MCRVDLPEGQDSLLRGQRMQIDQCPARSVLTADITLRARGMDNFAKDTVTKRDVKSFFRGLAKITLSGQPSGARA